MSLTTSRLALSCSVLILALSLGAQDPTWKRDNDKGNRYEGTTTQLHALRNYELRGFFADRPNFLLQQNSMLALKFFLPPNSKPFISAKEIRVAKQYLMLAKEESVSLKPGDWSEFKDWDGKFLKQNAIPPDNLGVVVRLNSEAEYNEEIAPVILTADSSPQPKSIREYTMYLTVHAKLRNIDYKVTGYDKPFLYKENDKNRSVEARSVVLLKIPTDKLPTGPIRVEITGQYANSTNSSEKLSARYRFYHQPR